MKNYIKLNNNLKQNRTSFQPRQKRNLSKGIFLTSENIFLNNWNLIISEKIIILTHQKLGTLRCDIIGS